MAAIHIGILVVENHFQQIAARFAINQEFEIECFISLLTNNLQKLQSNLYIAAQCTKTRVLPIYVPVTVLVRLDFLYDIAVVFPVFLIRCAALSAVFQHQTPDVISLIVYSF